MAIDNYGKTIREGSKMIEFSGKEMSGWESYGVKYPGGYFFCMGNAQVGAAAGELSMWGSYPWEECPVGFVQGGIDLEREV